MDWPGLMAAGLHRLALRPAQFWALTPIELQIMLGGQKAATPLNRQKLETLLMRFPDETKED